MSLDERVYLERVRIFFGLAKGNMAGIFPGALLIGFVLHMGGAAVQPLAIWGALIAVSWFAVVRYAEVACQQPLASMSRTVTTCFAFASFWAQALHFYGAWLVTCGWATALPSGQLHRAM